MLLATVGTGKHVMPSRASAALTDGLDHLAVRAGHSVSEALQVRIGMITKDLLNHIHEDTSESSWHERIPRINWFSLRRESSLP